MVNVLEQDTLMY